MSNFVDQVKITAKAGNGGNGSASFHREKYVMNGGPDGGDGGKGGDVVIKADARLSSLLDYYYKTKYTAGYATVRPEKETTRYVLNLP